MSMYDWLAIGLSLAGSLTGAYVGVRLAVAKLEVRVKHIESMLGTQDTGLAGAVFEHARDIVRLNGRIDVVETKTGH